MKILVWALAASLASISLALAGSHTDGAGTLSTPMTPIYIYASAGASQMALSVGTNTTLTVPAGATLAQICVETANIRYRDDGTAATTSSGIPVSSGTCFSYSGPLSALSFTAQSGSPTIDVSYYRAN